MQIRLGGPCYTRERSRGAQKHDYACETTHARTQRAHNRDASFVKRLTNRENERERGRRGGEKKRERKRERAVYFYFCLASAK